MRKIFFVAALCVAGLVSANNVKDGKEETKNTQKEVVVSSESGKVVESEVGFGCPVFTLSCGEKGTICRSSVNAMLLSLLLMEEEFCGGK